MAIPLPKVVADVGPGGPLVTSLNALNDLTNKMHTTRYNKSKADWADATIPAQAASQMAYAKFMYPQFMAKLMADPGFKGNTSNQQLRANVEMLNNAGNGRLPGNQINQMPGTQRPTNPLTRLVNNVQEALQGAFHPKQTKGQQLWNTFNQPMPDSNVSQPQNAFNQPTTQNQVQPQNQDGIDHELDAAYMDWMKSPEGQREIAKGEAGVTPNPQELKDRYNKKYGKPSTEMDMRGGQRAPEKTFKQNEADYRGAMKQGEKGGEIRAQNVGDIGNQQLQLSNTGNTIDKIIDGFTNPDFIAMRNEFPLMQDMQLKAITKIGNAKQQAMVGSLVSALEKFKGDTVNQFKGQTLKREFDYADKIKPDENDTVYTAMGKMQTLKSLKDIAYKKNELIEHYVDDEKMSLAKAVQRADKEIDISAIDKKVAELTEPTIKIKSKKKPTMVLYLTKTRAKELRFNNVK
jgi:hypothetical protein